MGSALSGHNTDHLLVQGLTRNEGQGAAMVTATNRHGCQATGCRTTDRGLHGELGANDAHAVVAVHYQAGAIVPHNGWPALWIDATVLELGDILRYP